MPLRIPENELGNYAIGLSFFLLIAAIISGYWEGWWLIVISLVSGLGLNYFRNKRNGN